MTLSDVDSTKMHKLPKRSGRDDNGWKKWPKKAINYKKKGTFKLLTWPLEAMERNQTNYLQPLFKLAVKYRPSVNKPVLQFR
jgi:hypothetical protein